MIAKHDETKRKLKKERDHVREELECTKADLQSKLNADASMKAEAEKKLNKKQEKLDSLKAEYNETEKQLKKERDDVREELEHTKADLRGKIKNDASLRAAELKLKMKQEELDNLKAEHKETERILKKELGDLKEELKVKQLELERTKANLHVKEELSKANIELARRDVQLQHANELQSLNEEQLSECKKRVNDLMMENAALRKEREEDRLLSHAHRCVDGHREEARDKSKTLHSGEYNLNNLRCQCQYYIYIAQSYAKHLCCAEYTNTVRTK